MFSLFEISVKNNFYFLTTYGYSLGISDKYSVEYLSDKQAVRITCDKLCNEINEWIELEDKYVMLYEILEYKGVAKDFPLFATSENLHRIIETHSLMFKQYALEYISGNIQCFFRIAEERQKKALNYTNKILMSQVLNDANYAWKTKNYNIFIELLFPFKKWLSPSEKAKLTYALKHRFSSNHLSKKDE
jgi:hypothetical protein